MRGGSAVKNDVDSNLLSETAKKLREKKMKSSSWNKKSWDDITAKSKRKWTNRAFEELYGDKR